MPSSPLPPPAPPEPPQPPSVHRIAIPTSDGLDLRCEWSAPDYPDAAAVLCHPHPLHGGNMYASLIDLMFRAMPRSGVAALRFNFRGVAGSEGSFGYGDGEQLDLVAAIAAASLLWPDVGILLVGWSFGADIALTSVDEKVLGWFGVAPPLRSVDIEDMGARTDHRPKLLCVPENDQFNPPAIAANLTADWATTRVDTVEGTDHFLVGQEESLSEKATSYARGLARTA